jgi:hypothetical protein
VAFTAGVSPSLGARLDRVRRERELAGDERAGSSVHQQVLAARVEFLKRNGWRLLGAVVVLALPVFWLYLLLPSDFAHGVIVGAFAVGVPMAVGSVVVSATGTTSLSMGADAERWTASALRSGRRRGWRLVNDVTLTKGNIDHVLVGPSGAWAVETKWTSALDTTEYGKGFWAKAIVQVQANARLLGMWHELRSRGVAVRPLLVVWGPGSKGISRPGWIVHESGVTIVAGHSLRGFLRLPDVPDLSRAQIDGAWEALDKQVTSRDLRDARSRGGSAGDRVTRTLSFVAATLLFGPCFVSLWVYTSTAWTFLFAALTVGSAIVLVRMRYFTEVASGWLTGAGLSLLGLVALVVLR